MVWNNAMTAVTPMTTSPVAVMNTIRAIRPTGSRMIARTMPIAKMKTKRCQSRMGTWFPLDLSKFRGSIADPPPVVNISGS